ncbi:IS630 family transposase [Bradyrhizobium cajani]|uniref:IS630 family transposase n=1 Tax=Bradyrhizobium cajani TaxID=1928661 RepID=A0A844TF01_9BRAD|nr:IS630 family transposase [Bradyrhizobium cajani]MCP3368604.1 IS630 family transposase [Bradyrhizobium cajani]MVT73601.1 IS630 family transposase [Bradyrhizobium cajani]
MPRELQWVAFSGQLLSGLLVSTVHRIWRGFGLQPQLLESSSARPMRIFVVKVRDVVGLYVSPPEHAIVLCVDEKSPIQALDCSQPMLPMRPGQPARRSHDCKRHGTTSLFAALDIATRRVIGKCYGRHRADEFRKFLIEIEAAAPRELDVHLVKDNYATHTGQKATLACAPDPDQFVMAQSGRALLRPSYRRLSHRRRPQGGRHLVHDPKPFRLTKSADDILASIESFCRYNAPAAHEARVIQQRRLWLSRRWTSRSTTLARRPGCFLPVRVLSRLFRPA